MESIHDIFSDFPSKVLDYYKVTHATNGTSTLASTPTVPNIKAYIQGVKAGLNADFVGTKSFHIWINSTDVLANIVKEDDVFKSAGYEYKVMESVLRDEAPDIAPFYELMIIRTAV